VQDSTPPRSLGKIQAASYPWLKHKVVLVPMEAGLSLNAASKALNDIFAPYGITIEVTIDDVFTDRPWGDGKLSVQAIARFE
jgi:hypothetical protein